MSGTALNNACLVLLDAGSLKIDLTLLNTFVLCVQSLKNIDATLDTSSTMFEYMSSASFNHGIAHFATSFTSFLNHLIKSVASFHFVTFLSNAAAFVSLVLTFKNSSAHIVTSSISSIGKIASLSRFCSAAVNFVVGLNVKSNVSVVHLVVAATPIPFLLR